MKKITKLVASLVLLTLLTGCTIKGVDPSDNNNNQNQNQNNNNGNGSGNYNGDGTNNNDSPSGDPSLPTVTNSISVEDLAEIYDWENGEPYSEFNMDSKIVISSSGTPVGNNALNTGRYYESDDTYRIYGNEYAKLVFQAPAGQYIRGRKLAFSGGTFKEGLQTGVMKEFNTNKVTLNVTYVKSGALKITAFEVKYTGEKGTTPSPRTTWSNEELALIDEYAYGIEIPYYRIKGNELCLYQESEDDEGFLTLYGAEITVSEMAPYAQLFRAAENWEELSETTETNNLFFEAHTTTDDGERYIRAHMYVCDYFGYMIEDDEVGYFNLDFEDPYFYSWPTEVVASVTEYLGSTATIPAIPDISRLEISNIDEESFLFVSYNHTEAQFNNYLTVLGQTFDLETFEGISFGVPKALDDLEIYVEYNEDDNTIMMGAIKHLPHLDSFPQTQVKAVNGGNDIPAPEGASYYTYEEQVEYYEDEDTGEEVSVVVDAIASVYGIDSDEFDNFLANGFAVGNWEVTPLGVDDLDNPTIEYYIAQLFKNDNTYYEFLMSYDLVEEVLTMDIYPMVDYYFSNDYPTSIINAFLTANELGSVPSFETAGVTHYIFVETEYYIWVFVQGDYEEAWLDILEDAGYTIPQEPTDYGYECRNEDAGIEIDILYDESYGQTGFTIYPLVSSDTDFDWDDLDW